MVPWLVALGVGIAVAALQYGPAGARRELPAALFRGAALTLLVALLLDAPAGASRAVRPLAALDVSASWQRGGPAAYATALQHFRALSRTADSTFLFGDSLRHAAPPAVPTDTRSSTREVVDRALAAGRPLVLVTDGELDDPDALANLPSGSILDVIPRRAASDAAITAVDAPRAVVGGDTVPIQVTVAAGTAGAGAGTLTVLFDNRTLASTPLAPLDPSVERVIPLRVVVPSEEGAGLLRAIVTVPGDVEARNDTLERPLEISPAAGAVFVSTSPDYDARYALAVLRGAVSLPTRGFFRVAPGNWRIDGTLAQVSETEVRKAVANAPLVVLHGDTALFGPPRISTRGSLVLFPGPGPEEPGEWYATGAPPSPLAAGLGAIAWDSLPPIESPTATYPAAMYWEGLETRRARHFDRRVPVIGTVSGRRVVIVNATGLWRWEFRGGVAADAYAALWGGIFDWLSAERPDVRVALPVDGAVRAGEPVEWRRGSGSDSVVTVVLTRRGSGAADTVALHFGDASTAESAPMARGVYDVRTTGGSSLLVVNPSREWLPNRARVRPGAIGGGAVAGLATHVRAVWWLYLALVGALCGEWIVRRSLGLR
jgi:hypothetical protein